jgi:carboxyl-terminal processing protease
MIGYIKITEFIEDTDELFIAALYELEKSGAKGIVFDLRNNPGGMLETVVNMLAALAPEGTPIVSYQDKLSSSPTVLYAKSETAIKIPLAFICNENTASAGELFCSALRDWSEMGIIDVTSVGTTTYGKGVMQRTFANLQNGSAITLTIAYYNPPSGENYDGIGVTPTRVETDENRQLEYAYLDLAMLISADEGWAA